MKFNALTQAEDSLQPDAARPSIDEPLNSPFNFSFPLKVLRMPAVQERTGYCRTSIYNRIQCGLWPKQVHLGGQRAVGWLEHEVSAMLAAYAAGKSEADIRTLVVHLEAQRKTFA